MILDGKKVAKKVIKNAKEKILNVEDEITLAIIILGDDSSSRSYINGVIKTSKRIGVLVKLIELDSEVNTEEVILEVEKLNNDDSISGIMLQMPLPKSIDSNRVINSVSSDKDIDGLTDTNLGKLLKGEKPGFIPCTPLAILKIIEFYEIDLNGLEVVVVGRSNIVGKPIANILTNLNATVTICHSKTKRLAEKTKKAELLIVAVGKKEFITKDMVSDKAIVIDVGINVESGKLYGDVKYEELVDYVKAITPVPGGVGSITNALLIDNTIDGYIKK